MGLANSLNYFLYNDLDAIALLVDAVILDLKAVRCYDSCALSEPFETFSDSQDRAFSMIVLSGAPGSLVLGVK